MTYNEQESGQHDLMDLSSDTVITSLSKEPAEIVKRCSSPGQKE
jgi:hypothetical protein